MLLRFPTVKKYRSLCAMYHHYHPSHAVCCLILQLYLVPSIFFVLGVVSTLQTSIDVDRHSHKTFSVIVLHYGGINFQVILFCHHHINSPPWYMTIFYIMTNLMYSCVYVFISLHIFFCALSFCIVAN